MNFSGNVTRTSMDVTEKPIKIFGRIKLPFIQDITTLTFVFFSFFFLFVNLSVWCLDEFNVDVTSFSD